MAKRGDIDGGLASLDEGLRLYRKTGAERNLVSYHMLLADVHTQTGTPERGLAAIAEALALIAHTEEWRWTPEILRARGTLLLLTDDAAESRQLFEQGRALAAGQRAKSLELRCAISLARLLAERDRHAEARAVLEPVYGWFTEGFATADLIAARELLDGLSEAPDFGRKRRVSRR
jgi:predicted ATPase